jgi:hypothetical protein
MHGSFGIRNLNNSVTLRSKILKIMTKLLRSISILLFAALLLTSCNKNTPKEVASAWLNCFWKLDYDGAKKYSTEETKNLLMQVEYLANAVSDSDKKEMKKLVIDIKNVKEEGDKAVVTYTMSESADKEQYLNLVKVKGQWQVMFTKTDEMQQAQEVTPEHISDRDTTGPATQTIEINTPVDTAKHKEEVNAMESK